MDYRNKDELYASLGSFWTWAFGAKQFVKGWSAAQANELAEMYLRISDLVTELKLTGSPGVLHSNFKPLVIEKKYFQPLRVRFGDEDLVFQAVTEDDHTFFGDSVPGQWEYPLSTDILEFGDLSDRILSPENVFIYGSDVILKDGYFTINQDLFTVLPSVPVITERGEIETFTDQAGDTVENRLVVLWLSNAKEKNVNFVEGYKTVFSLDIADFALFDRVMDGLIRLYVSGPTNTAIRELLVAFFETEDIDVVDNVSKPGWWRDMNVSKFALPAKIFFGAKNYNVYLENNVLRADYVVVRDSEDEDVIVSKTLTLPVFGSTENILAYHNYINASDTQDSALEFFGFIQNDTSQTKYINMYDHLFDSLFYANTVGITLNIAAIEQAALFGQFLDIVKHRLAPQINYLFFIEATVDAELIEDATDDDDLILSRQPSWTDEQTTDELSITSTSNIFPAASANRTTKNTRTLIVVDSLALET